MRVREIILDTETTGLDPKRGDRLIEIGCIELYNRIPTGREYHCFINPERDVPAEAQAVHGLSTDFLKDKPVFAKEFLSRAGLDEALSESFCRSPPRRDFSSLGGIECFSGAFVGPYCNVLIECHG